MTLLIRLCIGKWPQLCDKPGSVENMTEDLLITYRKYARRTCELIYYYAAVNFQIRNWSQIATDFFLVVVLAGATSSKKPIRLSRFKSDHKIWQECSLSIRIDYRSRIFDLTLRFQDGGHYDISRNKVFIGVRARGVGGCSPPDSGKGIIFRAKAEFSGRSQQSKMKKRNICCIY